MNVVNTLHRLGRRVIDSIVQEYCTELIELIFLYRVGGRGRVRNYEGGRKGKEMGV